MHGQCACERRKEKEREGREGEKVGISSRVVLLLNEIVESIFLTARISYRLQLSESSLLNILLIKFRVLSFS